MLGEAMIETDKELTQYFLTDEPKSPTLAQANKNQVHMNIVFKRRLTNEAMMTFFPSILLIAISYSTSFFRLPNFFNTAITVNLSVMLTLTTLLISVVKKLAQTSYIKWIEYWLIFAQLIPFTQVILITCLEALKERKGEEREVRGEAAMERSKEQCLVAIGGKQVKVGVPQAATLSQVRPLVPVPPSPPGEKPRDIAHVISTIERRAVPAVIAIAFTVYWVFGLMFHFGVI